MGKQLAVVVDESNRKKLDAKVRMIEKDIPEPGTGEVLVRITLRPVSSLKTEYYIADNELAGYYVHDVMRQDVRLLGSTIGDIDIKVPDASTEGGHWRILLQYPCKAFY